MEKTQHNIKERTNYRFEQPPMYIVIMHNDDFTTMEFVVKILKTVFFKPEYEAVELMLKVHKENAAVIGRYTLDMAASKCKKATSMAEKEGYPFKVTYEIEPNELPF